MSDQNNTADTFGGGAHRRVTERDLPKPVRPVPTFGDERDAGVISDSDRVVEQLRSTLARDVSGINKPTPDRQPATTSSPLKEIASRIKKLVHDDGEQFGDELKAKIDSNGDKMSVAKALQKWADDTLQPDKEKESQRGA